MASAQIPALEAVARTELVLDSLPRAIIVTDLVGVIVAWNRRAEELYGWPRADAMGRTVYEVLMDSPDPDRAQSFLRHVVASQRWTGEATIHTRDGGRRRVATFLEPLRDDNGRVVGIVGAAEDVSDLRALQERASDLTDHLVLALAAGGLGTFRWDMQTGETRWDAATEAAFGLEPGTFDGTYESYVSLLHPDDRDQTLAIVADAVERKGAYDVSHRVVWPDGSVHWLHGRGQVTLDANGDVTGAIGCVGDDTARKLTEFDVQRRADAAERLVASERLLRQRIEFLSALNDAALVASDHRDLMRRVTNAAVPRLGDWCALHFLTHPDSAPETEVAHSDPSRVQWARDLQTRFPYDPYAPTGVPAVIRSGVTEFIATVDDDIIEAALEAQPRLDAQQVRDVLGAIGITSVITVALTTRGGVIGAIQFVSAESGRPYDLDDVTLAEAAAGRIAEALASAWSSDHQREVSSKLQAALLPSHLPDIAGLDVAVLYRAGASMDVGGDFYDLFEIRPGRWALAIGDVCGTGPDAAAVTAKARHTIRAAATHGIEPVEVLQWLNDAIIAGDRGLFCTALYATIDRLHDGTWMLRSIAGGHPLPVLVDADGSVRPLGVPGTLLGVLPELELTVTETILRPGDSLVLYTDGITDARPPYDLDPEALLALIRSAAEGIAETAHGFASSITANMLAGIEGVLPVARRNDDMALLVIHVEATDATATAAADVNASAGQSP